MMKIAFVGGGTGGHFYPLIAVADEIQASDSKAKLYYIGPNPYNTDLLKEKGIKFISCPAGKQRTYKSAQNFLDVFVTFYGIIVAIFKLYALYPDVVFSKGGYTSVPVLIAAKILMIPIVIHESDAVPGRANKLAAPLAQYIGIAHEEAAQFFPKEKTALIGIPLRKELSSAHDNPFEELGIPNNLPLIYVTGGSLGAERINNLIIRSLADLLPHYRIFHQTGEKTFGESKLTAQKLLEGSPLQNNYYIQSSVPTRTVSLLLSAASVVITRAGSTTLFEIALYGKPAIIIPIPEDISRDQRANAYSYARNGAAVVIEEENLSTHLLAQEISSIINDQEKYNQMSVAAKSVSLPDAAEKIANILTQIGKKHES